MPSFLKKKNVFCVLKNKLTWVETLFIVWSIEEDYWENREIYLYKKCFYV